MAGFFEKLVDGFFNSLRKSQEEKATKAISKDPKIQKLKEEISVVENRLSAYLEKYKKTEEKAVVKNRHTVDVMIEAIYRTSLITKGIEVSELVKEIYIELRPLNDFVKFSSSEIIFFKNSNSNKKYTYLVYFEENLPIKLYIRFFGQNNIKQQLIAFQKIIQDAEPDKENSQIIISLNNIKDFKSILYLL